MIGEYIKVGEIITAKAVSLTNVLGGTDNMKRKVRVRITKAWEDDECGWFFHGKLLDDKDIEQARGIAGLDPETKALAKSAHAKIKPFKNVVCVNEFDIIDPILKKVRAGRERNGK